MEREAMEFDVVVVGGGPSGLATAIRIRQLSQEIGEDISVCLVEKGSEIGAHILSGAILETTALNELFPDWKEMGAPLDKEVDEDEYLFLLNKNNSIKIPNMFVPDAAHNAHRGNYAISLGNMCRWLGEQAEAMEVAIFPGFAATEVLYNEDGAVRGVATGDMGVGADGEKKGSFQAGYELLAKYTVFAEGCRGQLGKELMHKYHLQADAGTQHYGIGIKEVWDIDPAKSQPGKVTHTVGAWPMKLTETGGGFLYHLENNQVALGLIIDLSYKNPYLSPFDEFQTWKTHPMISTILEGGTRIAYGARALVKGGHQAVPKCTFPGGLIVGDDAGFLNFLKIKGSHTAMKSGMMAAETIVEALQKGSEGGEDLINFTARYKDSWLHEELYKARNVNPMIHKMGMLFGSAYAFVDQVIFRGKLPFTFSDETPDHATLLPAVSAKKKAYAKPDGKISFDKLSSVFLSNTNHEEDQPCHLRLADAELPISKNLPIFDEPAQRYCPAGVYEVVHEEGSEPKFQINSQNCVHCKTCDIKDPAQNITWVSPEGTGGPNYPNM